MKKYPKLEQLRVVSTSGAKKFKEGADLEKIKALWGVTGDTDEEIINNFVEKSTQEMLDKFEDEEFQKMVEAKRRKKDKELLKGKFLILTNQKEIN